MFDRKMLWPLFYALFYLATESETVDESKKSGDPDKLVDNNCDQTDESFDAFSRILFQYNLGYPGHNNLMNYAEDLPRHNQQPTKIAGYANLTNQSTKANLPPKPPAIKTNTFVDRSKVNACPPKPPTIITNANLPPKPPTIKANLPPKPPTSKTNTFVDRSKTNLPPKPPAIKTNTFVDRSKGHANLTNQSTEANIPPKPPTIKTNTFVDRSKGHASLTNQSTEANLPPKPPAIKPNTFVDRSKGHGTNHFAENRKITIKIKGLSVGRSNGNSNSSLKIDKSAKLKSNDENLPKNQIHLKTKFKNLSVLSGTSNTGTVSLPANDPSQSDGSDQQQQEDSSDGDVSMFEAQNSSEDSDTYSSDLAAASQPTPAAINTTSSSSSFDAKSADHSAADDEDDASGESGVEMAQKMPTNKNAQTDGRRQTRDGISSASGTKNFENTEKGGFSGNAGNHKRSSY